MNAFRIAWLACRDLFDELFTLMLVNFIWVVISLPLLGIAISLAFSEAYVPAVLAALLAMLLLSWFCSRYSRAIQPL
ncbi:MAG TPA: hypothetical protein PKC19_04050, partial [Roseiflexaceae bacterium]|nr:hypothetical protein [Roseiflexaceae bacterium]